MACLLPLQAQFETDPGGMAASAFLGIGLHAAEGLGATCADGPMVRRR